MPEVDAHSLRIYCICGQKMKVSPSMYGRPGKCVACRQKIRIPREEEIPSGECEIYLRDHPEFLRKRPGDDIARLSVKEMELSEDTEGEALLLGDTASQVDWVPLDPLEPLQRLCSFEYTIDRQLATLQKAGNGIGVQEKAALQGYRVLVRKARSGLDDQMRRRLHEVVEQLTAVEEQVARATVALRLGELTYSNFAKTVLPLRQLRERMQRRQTNLRGWLAIHDPFLAGGYIDVQLEDVPCEAPTFVFGLEPQRDQSLLDSMSSSLRQALRDREQIERKLAEWNTMEAEKALSEEALAECRTESKAAEQCIRARITYYRERLEQIAQDAENDNKAIKAYLEGARLRLEKEELAEHAYQAQEMELLRGQSDNRQVAHLARRALHANTAADVPAMRGTLLYRITHPVSPTGIGMDSWIAWITAVFMILAILLPISDAQIGGNMVAFRELVIGLFIFAVSLCVIAILARRLVRGLLLTAVVSLFWLGVLFSLQHIYHSAGAVGEAMRSNPHWWLQPGIVILFLCITGVCVAAITALMDRPYLRIVSALVLLFCALLSIIVITSGFGLLKPRPYIIPPEVRAAPQTDTYEVTIRFGNQGYRAMQLGEAAQTGVYPFTYLLEKRIGSDSWADISTPKRMKVAQGPWQNSLQYRGFPPCVLHNDDEAILEYNLPPGEYRIQLISQRNNTKKYTHRFELAALSHTAATPQESAEQTQESVRAEESSINPSPRRQVMVELRGMMKAQGRQVRFPITVTLPDGKIEQYNLQLGDAVHGQWKALEFNPSRNTLTLTNGTRMLILEPGQAVTIPEETSSSPSRSE